MKDEKLMKNFIQMMKNYESFWNVRITENLENSQKNREISVKFWKIYEKKSKYLQKLKLPKIRKFLEETLASFV